jgi:hypothetical protein
MNQLPASLLVNAYGGGGTGLFKAGGHDQSISQDPNTGGGQPHGHGIAAATAHTHAATLPKVFATILVERIA